MRLVDPARIYSDVARLYEIVQPGVDFCGVAAQPLECVSKCIVRSAYVRSVASRQ